MYFLYLGPSICLFSAVDLGKDCGSRRLTAGFHRARLRCVPAATRFCSVLCRVLYPTGSISEAECFAGLILLTCSDFIDLVICPWCLCFYHAQAGCFCVWIPARFDLQYVALHGFRQKQTFPMDIVSGEGLEWESFKDLDYSQKQHGAKWAYHL